MGALAVAATLAAGWQLSCSEQPQGTSAFRADFENGRLGGWDNTLAPSGGVHVVDSPALGKYAVKISTEDGKCIKIDQDKHGECKRYHSQLVKNTDERPGTDSRWSESIFWPDGFHPNPDVFNDFGGWHPRSGDTPCQGNVALETPRGSSGPDYSLEVTIHGGHSCADNVDSSLAIGSFSPGRWHRIDWHIKWSTGDDGFVEVSVDGEKKGRLTGPNQYEDSGGGPGVYFKLGLYSGRGGGGTTVFFDDIRGEWGIPS